MNVLNTFNDIYKGVKPFAAPIVDALPYGNYINKGLDAASNVIDNVQPYTNRWIKDGDRKITDKIPDCIPGVWNTGSCGKAGNKASICLRHALPRWS